MQTVQVLRILHDFIVTNGCVLPYYYFLVIYEYQNHLLELLSHEAFEV